MLRKIDPHIALGPRTARYTNSLDLSEPEVIFRITHVTIEDFKENPPYREQAVEIALGPKGAFKNGNVGKLTRQVPADQVVNAVPPSTAKPRPPKEARTPRVTELLRKAVEWQGLLNSGEVPTLAEIAQREDLSRARITQIMSLLHLAPKIQEYILSMPKMSRRPAVTERSLRPLTLIEDQRHQIEVFERLAGQ